MPLGRRVPCLPLPGKPRPPSPQSDFSSISPSSPLSSSCLWSQIISYGSGRFHWKSIHLCVYIHVLCVCVLSISIHHRRTGIMYAMYATRMRAGIAGNYIALALQLLRNFCFSVGSKPASYACRLDFVNVKKWKGFSNPSQLRMPATVYPPAR